MLGGMPTLRRLAEDAAWPVGGGGGGGGGDGLAAGIEALERMGVTTRACAGPLSLPLSAVSTPPLLPKYTCIPVAGDEKRGVGRGSSAPPSFRFYM